jgi:hypothetical protein
MSGVCSEGRELSSKPSFFFLRRAAVGPGASDFVSPDLGSLPYDMWMTDWRVYTHTAVWRPGCIPDHAGGTQSWYPVSKRVNECLYFAVCL